MQHYYAYTTEQFVWDDLFRSWVLSPTLETDSIWQQWLVDHPEKAGTVQQARELVQALQVREIPLTEAELDEAVQHIVASTTEKPALRLPKSLFGQYGWQIAASLAMVLGLAWWLWQTQTAVGFLTHRPLQTQQRWQERVNTSNQSLMVSLSDGSVVVLRPHSRIRFPATFAADKRDVRLSGEAFFEVARNPTRPFYVTANEVVTKVLGTSFSVRAFDNEAAVSVKVRTGRVMVSAPTVRNQSAAYQPLASTEVVLKARQQVAYSRKKLQLTKSSLPESVQTNTDPVFRRFQFDDTPLPTVFETLEKAYGVVIVYNRTQLNNCPLTARFADQSLYEMLQFVCTALDGSYVVQDGRIVIDVNGCKE